ncbi:MAG: hypothetical protein ABFC94_18095 [Syntrophomonas sp.]
MGNDEANGALFGQRLVKKTSPTMIAIITDAIRWTYDTDPTNDTLRGTANYLIWLCGAYGLQARALSGGGTVTPINPGGLMPAKIEFYVNDTDSYILDGGDTFTLPVAWTGFDLLVFRNGNEQTVLTDGTDSSYTWNPITRIFTCTPAASTGDKFSIAPN